MWIPIRLAVPHKREWVRRRKHGSRPDRRAFEIQEILAHVEEHEREALRRFYLLGQSQEQICSDLDIARERFLEVKRRVRERFNLQANSI